MIATNGVANQNRFYRPDHPNPSGNHSTWMITLSIRCTPFHACFRPNIFLRTVHCIWDRVNYAVIDTRRLCDLPFYPSFFLLLFFHFLFFFWILMTVHGRCSWRLCMPRGCNREQSVPRCSRIFFRRSVACYLRSEGDDEAHSFATFGKI